MIGEQLVMILQRVQMLENKVNALSSENARLRRLYVDNSFQMGVGDTAFHADQEGFWWGQEKLADITTGTPIAGTAILMDGTVYAKNGYTGSKSTMTGSITFVNGICTG